MVGGGGRRRGGQRRGDRRLRRRRASTIRGHCSVTSGPASRPASAGPPGGRKARPGEAQEPGQAQEPELGHCRWCTSTLLELVEQARLGLLEQLERGRRFRVARLVRVAAERQLAEALRHLLLAHVPHRLSREIRVRLGQLQPVEVVGRAQDRRDLLGRATRRLPTAIEHHRRRRRRGGGAARWEVIRNVTPPYLGRPAQRRESTRGEPQGEMPATRSVVAHISCAAAMCSHQQPPRLQLGR